MSKESIVVTFFGFLGGQAGTIDGTMELGESIQNCNKDKWDVAFSVASTAGNFISHLGIGNFGRFGGKTSMISATLSLGRGILRGDKINWSDAATLLAGAAGILAKKFSFFTPVGAILNIGGLAITLYDLYDNLYNGGGNANNQCSAPTPPPQNLGPGIPNKGKPDTGPASKASPLIIDMDGNGIKTISINKNVLFDLDNNLFAENTGWVDKGDAFLVWDRDGNGTIDSGNELFGNHSLLQNGEKAANGFAALAELDGNKDKVFDASDEAWTRLQLWFDHNQNGISEEGELIKLADSQIKSINLNYQDINRTDESGNTHRQHSSVTWTDGKTTDINDVWFATNPALSYSRQQIEISDEIKALPNVIAFGNVLNLHQAMATNSTLKNQITVK